MFKYCGAAGKKFLSKLQIVGGEALATKSHTFLL